MSYFSRSYSRKWETTRPSVVLTRC